MMKRDCLFCKIINKEFPSEIIGENSLSLAFRDINPQAPSHILIIPKMHIPSTIDINRENSFYLIEMLLLANEIAEVENILQNGYRWVMNTGNHGGQTIGHLHLHLLGGRQLNWPPG